RELALVDEVVGGGPGDRQGRGVGEGNLVRLEHGPGGVQPVCSANAPSPRAGAPSTASPTAKPSVPSPTAVTIPEASSPIASGRRPPVPNAPSRRFQSAGFTPAARTSIPISPVRGAGTSRWVSCWPSGPP